MRLKYLMAVFLWGYASSASGEHCFSDGSTWLKNANTGRLGHWNFVPAPGPMGPTQSLPITCFQQDVRFEKHLQTNRLVFLNPASVAAEKCIKTIGNSNLRWEHGWDDLRDDWRVTVFVDQMKRDFSIRCNIMENNEREIRLSSELIPGKAGEVRYVWRPEG